MYLAANTLDDLLRKVFKKLLATDGHITASRGAATEVTGVLLELTNPTARLSRTETKGTIFSCLGELLWYLSEKNELDFIVYYVPYYKKESKDGKTIYGGYGPRLFRMRDKPENNQIKNIIDLLIKKPSSRRAVIQIFNAEDIAHDGEIPCTCTLQFLIRSKRLHMLVNMRSNDAYLGLPHDIYAFTMIQEIIARTLKVELGVYKQAVGSLHLYKRDREQAEKYLREGIQSSTSMPAMPEGDPWSAIATILKAESTLRSGTEIDISELQLSPYWADIVRLLQVYRKSKDRKPKAIEQIAGEISTKIYDVYILKKKKRLLRINYAQKQNNHYASYAFNTY